MCEQMESLARAQQAADAPRSRLDSALADLTERVDELRAAVAEVERHLCTKYPLPSSWSLQRGIADGA